MSITNIDSDWSSGNLIIKRAYSGTAASIEFGVDDNGIDVKAYGATTGKYMLWDESADKLIVVGTTDAGTSLEADAYTVGGTSGASWTSGASPTSMRVINGIITYMA